MKKEKEWLKEAIEGLISKYESFPGKTDWNHGYIMALHDYKNLINQLDEPKKPVIPQFVADYYKDYKYYELTFEEWFEFPESEKEGKTESKTFEWLLDNSYEVNIERQFILADIIANGLDGYEVEKEKNYEVTIGKGTWVGYTSVVVLYKSVDKTMVLREMSEEDYEGSKRRAPTSFWLTEKEIKDYDERYWVFAEEVTE